MANQGKTESEDNQSNEHQTGEHQTDGDSSQKQQGAEQPSVWEWLVALIGLVLVLGSVGFMGYEAVAGDESPPDIKLYIREVRAQNNGYLVQFTAENQGGSTAAGLQVEGELMRNGRTVASSQTVLDYVPAHSQRRGGLFFDSNPQEFQIELRATGYQEP